MFRICFLSHAAAQLLGGYKREVPSFLSRPQTPCKNFFIMYYSNIAFNTRLHSAV